jgi:hypothetical protein
LVTRTGRVANLGSVEPQVFVPIGTSVSPYDLHLAPGSSVFGGQQVNWSRDFAGGMLQTARKLKNPDMTYHGGKILPTVVSKAIYWGPSWANATFVGDKISGLDAFYTGFNFSNYAATSNEYTGTNGQVGSTTMTHQGHVLDVSTASGGGSTSAILAEVCKQVSAGNIIPDLNGNGYYPVYVDLPRGTAGYCGYHSAGSCGATPVQFAFFWNLDGDAGCDPVDTQTGHSQGLSALANLSAKEISAARTDPANPGAWYDANGQENGDKCAWTFNVPFVTFPDGNKWKLQGEWSNNAFNARTGYPTPLSRTVVSTDTKTGAPGTKRR